MFIAALSQSPAEPAWLQVIPGDAELAVRVRGTEATRDDLVTMLKAMSPSWGKMAEDGLAKPLAEIREKHGEHALTTPFVTLLRLPQPGAAEDVLFAVLVVSDQYQGVLKELSGGKDVELKHQDGGYDAFDGPDGHGTWYAVKRPGIVAFGPDKERIAALAKPDGKSLDKVLSGSAAKPFLSGDLGLYINAAVLSTRYADQIEQGRQALMAFMDQAGQVAGNEASIKAAKEIYGGLFDSLKYADLLTLDLDFAAEGLHLAGILTVKADSDAAKRIATAPTSSASNLANFAAGALAYLYMNLDAKTFDQLQGMSLRMLQAGGKPTPELERAMAQLHGLGRIETIGSVSMAGGMRVLNDIKVPDPKKYIAANQAMLQAMKGGEGQLNFYKDLKIEPDAKTYEDLTFTHIVATLDLDKLAQLSGNNPAGAASIKAMFGGDLLSYWYGTDGKRLLQVITPTWDDAKAQIDAYLKGGAGIGATPGFQAVRSRLPERASLLAMLSAQGLVQMFAAQFAATFNNPNLKVPGDLPKEPALVGFSLTPQPPAGYEFHLVVPSPVGTVIDKGMVPLFQGLQAGNVNQ
jgi:hypothetical protein